MTHDVIILDRFGSHLFNSFDCVNSFSARILLYFLNLHEVHTLCISTSISFTYVSEMIVCQAIYQSVINEI